MTLYCISVTLIEDGFVSVWCDEDTGVMYEVDLTPDAVEEIISEEVSLNVPC